MLGVDGSNGVEPWRAQLDNAPSPLEVLPEIREPSATR